MQKKDNNKLLNPASAIENYFDNLLQEEAVESNISKPVQLKNKLLLLTDLESQLSSIENTDRQENSLISGFDSNHSDEHANPDFKQSNEQPLYSNRIEFPVQCLMFYVCDNQLSIPLVDMLSVVSNVGSLTQLPRSPEWFLGLLKHRDNNIKVVDSARYLSIQRHQKKNNDNQHVLVFKDASLGITCDQLGEIIQLDEEDVKWSKPGSGGLAFGTIKKSLAILLDPEKILAQVENES